MIAAKHEEGFWVTDLERAQEHQSFNAEHAAIHEIAQEQVFSAGWVAAELENSQQVVVLSVLLWELPVDIADDSNRVAQLQNVGLVF